MLDKRIGFIQDYLGNDNPCKIIILFLNVYFLYIPFLYFKMHIYINKVQTYIKKLIKKKRVWRIIKEWRPKFLNVGFCWRVFLIENHINGPKLDDYSGLVFEFIIIDEN